MKILNTVAESRGIQRKSFNLNVSCVNISCGYNVKITPCEIIDLSPEGVCIKIDDQLLPGDRVNIILAGHLLPATVARSEGNKTGLLFCELTSAQSKYIKQLWRKEL